MMGAIILAGRAALRSGVGLVSLGVPGSQMLVLPSAVAEATSFGLAEEEGHHPALLTEWGRTTITWWTHKIKGLHRNDFIMAAKTDQLYQG